MIIDPQSMNELEKWQKEKNYEDIISRLYQKQMKEVYNKIEDSILA